MTDPTPDEPAPIVVGVSRRTGSPDALAFASRGAAGVASRIVVAALFVPLALSADRAVRASERRS